MKRACRSNVIVSAELQVLGGSERSYWRRGRSGGPVTYGRSGQSCIPAFVKLTSRASLSCCRREAGDRPCCTKRPGQHRFRPGSAAMPHARDPPPAPAAHAAAARPRHGPTQACATPKRERDRRDQHDAGKHHHCAPERAKPLRYLHGRTVSL